MPKEGITPEANFDETFAFLNILLILSKTTEFRKWLTDFHKLENHDKIFEGYKFLIVTSLLSFMNSILMHDPFQLKDDEILNRAEFRGIKLEKLPNSCEKIIFQKNVWRLGKKIRKSTTWNDLDTQRELSPILELLNKMLSKNLYSRKNIPKSEAITYVSEFYTYLFLIDTSHGRPKGYYLPFLSIEKSPEYLDKTFDGYVLALQFLWYKLLGNDTFRKTCVMDLHRCQEIQLRKDPSLEVDIGEEIELYEIEVTPQEKKEQEYRKSVNERWMAIDQFFNEIRSQIIWPLENNIGYQFGGFEDGLLGIKDFEKTTLGILLEKKNLQEPDYSVKDDPESKKKWLDVRFLWYDKDFLNGAEANLEFSGVFSFISLLTGYVKILQENESEGKIKVMKIIHPEKNRDVNYYSLAVLMGSYGIFSDSSGWIVFYDCLIDSPGTGGHYRDMCFDCIEKFRKNSQVDLEEITVEKEIFYKYLMNDKIAIAEIQKPLNQNKETFEKLSHARGKLFEYVFAKYLKDGKKYDVVREDFTLHGEQIDCMGIKDAIVHIFECKLQIHNDLKEPKMQIEKKIRAVKKEYPDCQILPFLVSYLPIMEERLLKLTRSGIGVEHNFRSILQNDREFDGERKRLLNILNSELGNKLYRKYDMDWFT